MRPNDSYVVTTVAVRWQAIAGAVSYTLTVHLSNEVQQYYALGIRGSGNGRRLTLSISSYLGARVSIAAQAPGRGELAEHGWARA